MCVCVCIRHMHVCRYPAVRTAFDIAVPVGGWSRKPAAPPTRPSTARQAPAGSHQRSLGSSRKHRHSSAATRWLLQPCTAPAAGPPSPPTRRHTRRSPRRIASPYPSRRPSPCRIAPASDDGQRCLRAQGSVRTRKGLRGRRLSRVGPQIHCPGVWPRCTDPCGD